MKHVVWTCLLILGLIGCTPSGVPSDAGQEGDNHFRLKFVGEAATEYGAQGGLAWRSKQLNAATNSKHQVLDDIYRFDQLMLAHHVVPPVLAESQDSMQLNGPDTIRLAAHTYRITQPAHFNTVNITWRNYLNMQYPTPSLPNESLLPRSPEEIAIWDKAIVQGWHHGIAQADAIFRNQLAHLQQDFTGMSLYHTLLAQHIVSSPFVSTTKLGITGNGDQIRVSDKILRITAISQLNPHGNAWDPGLSLHNK